MAPGESTGARLSDVRQAWQEQSTGLSESTTQVPSAASVKAHYRHECKRTWTWLRAANSSLSFPIATSSSAQGCLVIHFWPYPRERDCRGTYTHRPAAGVPPLPSVRHL